jgi:hypothetical protein
MCKKIAQKEIKDQYKGKNKNNGIKIVNNIKRKLRVNSQNRPIRYKNILSKGELGEGKDEELSESGKPLLNALKAQLIQESGAMGTRSTAEPDRIANHVEFLSLALAFLFFLSLKRSPRCDLQNNKK